MLEKLKQNLSAEVYAKYTTALPEEYLLKYKLEDIVTDCNLMAGLNQDNDYAITITDGESSADNIWQIKLLRLNDNVSLSRGLPIIENFGFKLLDEKPFKIGVGNNDHFVKEGYSAIWKAFVEDLEKCDFVTFHPNTAVTSIDWADSESTTITTSSNSSLLSSLSSRFFICSIPIGCLKNQGYLNTKTPPNNTS
jgi:hypothetical protein